MNRDLADRATKPTGLRRRRFWTSDEKRRIVAESTAPGASVSKVAQRHGVNANLLFTWRRRQARDAATGGLEPLKLLPVTVAEDGMAAAPLAPTTAGRMEIGLAGGARIVVGADVDSAALARVVNVLSRR
jgi:transposase-like protein